MINIEEYIINFGLMTTIIYLAGLLYKQFLVDINERFKSIILVVIAIFTGWVSMYFGIHLSDSVIFDLRFVPVIIATLYSTRLRYILLVGLGIGLTRFTFGFSEAAVVGFINMFFLGLVGVFLSWILRKWTYMKKMWVVILTINLVNTIVISVVGVIPAKDILFRLMPIVFPTNILLSLLLVWIVKDLIEEYRYKIELLEKARKDPLTQLLNRRAFMNHYQKYITNNNEGYPLALAFIDIDYFKEVNDVHGHIVGDLVLQRVSKIVSDNLRSIDVVARYGGDELVVILPHCPKQDAIKVMERIRTLIEKELITQNDVTIPITLSIGIATSPDIEPKSLLSAADEALYVAKSKGRNRIEWVG
ncbi:diguanylate cyclase [Peribacillus acanthi]|uniref:diguanylate cyclase n=1 Tax=Peribacillus acanthi TaxID=2171554 RepID=UPI000D3E9A12|nr:diguanylate cyclase [Peribacillus acanthi]